MEIFVCMNTDVFDDYSLDIYEISFLLSLAKFVDNNTGKCFPSMAKIAKAARMSERKAFQVKAKLIEKKAIMAESRYTDLGGQTSDIITLLDPRFFVSFNRFSSGIGYAQNAGGYAQAQKSGKKQSQKKANNRADVQGVYAQNADELNNQYNYKNNNNNYSLTASDADPIQTHQIEPNKPSKANTPNKAKTDSSNISLKAKKELSNNCPPSSVAPPKFYDETSGDELWAYIQNDESGISVGTLKTMCSGYGTFLKRNYKIEPTIDNLKAIVNRFCKWKADSEVSTVFNPAKAFKEMTKSTNTFEFFAAELNRADKPSGSGVQKASSSKTELKTTYKGGSQMPIYLVSHYEQSIPVLKERPEPAIASKAENRPYIFQGVYYARNLMLLNKLRADNDIPPFSHIPARCQTIEDKERWLINQDSTDDLKI